MVIWRMLNKKKNAQLCFSIIYGCYVWCLIQRDVSCLLLAACCLLYIEHKAQCARMTIQKGTWGCLTLSCRISHSHQPQLQLTSAKLMHETSAHSDRNSPQPREEIRLVFACWHFHAGLVLVRNPCTFGPVRSTKVRYLRRNSFSSRPWSFATEMRTERSCPIASLRMRSRCSFILRYCLSVRCSSS